MPRLKIRYALLRLRRPSFANFFFTDIGAHGLKENVVKLQTFVGLLYISGFHFYPFESIIYSRQHDYVLLLINHEKCLNKAHINVKRESPKKRVILVELEIQACMQCDWTPCHLKSNINRISIF